MQFVIAHLLHSYFSRLYIFRLDVVYISNDQVLIVYDTFLQIDTKDILFICGGAFIDLEKTISERLYDI